MRADDLLNTPLSALIRKIPLDALDARILLAYVLSCSRVDLITQNMRELTEEEAMRLSDLCQRRIDGEPVAYLIGEREFYGLTFKVDSNVLIPRPETELLVDLAIKFLPQGGSVLDLGTGSGAIAVSLAKIREDAHIMATDISLAALEVAKKNAKNILKEKASLLNFLSGYWYENMPKSSKFHLIVSNPPYIARNDEHLSLGDLRFEPHGALTDGADGLSCIREIIGGARKYLISGGMLLLEHGYNQAESVRKLLMKNGFYSVNSWKDLSGIERVSGGML